jgi:hypothetical protein
VPNGNVEFSQANEPQINFCNHSPGSRSINNSGQFFPFKKGTHTFFLIQSHSKKVSHIDCGSGIEPTKDGNSE